MSSYGPCPCFGLRETHCCLLQPVQRELLLFHVLTSFLRCWEDVLGVFSLKKQNAYPYVEPTAAPFTVIVSEGDPSAGCKSEKHCHAPVQKHALNYCTQLQTFSSIRHFKTREGSEKGNGNGLAFLQRTIKYPAAPQPEGGLTKAGCERNLLNEDRPREDEWERVV